MMTPQGIWEDGRFIKGLTAPQSWGVQPRNLTRYADGEELDLMLDQC